MPPELRAAIVQDAHDGRVLMLAWMDAEAERLTRETGDAWFWSRSRQELWHKGATSGAFQHVARAHTDCDADTILLEVHPDGPACHTGATSCFFEDIEAPADEPRVERGQRIIEELLPASY